MQGEAVAAQLILGVLLRVILAVLVALELHLLLLVRL
jgi:hypothetical protein